MHRRGHAASLYHSLKQRLSQSSFFVPSRSIPLCLNCICYSLARFAVHGGPTMRVHSCAQTGLQSVQNAAARLVTGTRRCNTSLQYCGSCTGYLCGNAFTTCWRVSPFVHCLVWRRITLPATVSWLATLDWDLCDPLSDVSALCHVRTARSAIDPSRRLGRVHGMSCRSVYATLLYRWLSSMHIWRPIYFPSRVGPRRICDIYDFFAPHINVLTYLLNR